MRVTDRWSSFAPFSATIPFDMNAMFLYGHMLMCSMEMIPKDELRTQIDRTTALCKLMGTTYPEDYPEYVQARLHLFTLKIISDVGLFGSHHVKDIEDAYQNGIRLVNSMERLYKNTQDLLGFVRDCVCMLRLVFHSCNGLR